jgi:exosome complex component RRP42
MSSAAEDAFIRAGFAADLRTDGRARNQYRQIDVATNFLAQCNGSARVQLGATDVVAGVKVCDVR